MKLIDMIQRMDDYIEKKYSRPSKNMLVQPGVNLKEMGQVIDGNQFIK